MLDFLKLMITARSGISSKRVCGVLGFIAVIAVLGYCTVHGILAPEMVDMFMMCIVGLLGVDSITGIWKNNSTNTNE